MGRTGTKEKSILKVRDIRVKYGAIEALKGIGFHVDEGEIISLIGANGAGKSTALRTLSGLLTPVSGDISFLGKSIVGKKAHDIVRRGLIHSPEGRGIFANLTVLENLQMGAYARTNKTEIAADLDHVFTLFPRLKERLKQCSGTLSGGEQQMLAISRALMSRPRLLLLDEPSLGLAPQFVQTIFSTIQRLNQEGVTILLVEQNAWQALKVAHRGYVLETGRIILEGKGFELLNNKEVQTAYLGYS